MSSPEWYAIHCKPQAERLVLEQLQMRGIEGYLPLWQLARRGERTVSPRPYFPCYLFAHADIEVVGVSALHYVPGVRSLVQSAGAPARVSVAVIDQIRSRLDRLAHSITDATGRPLRQGDHVRITDGPLAGFEAIFECALSDQERVRLLVNFIQQGAHVEVDRGQIEKLALARWAEAQVRRR